MEGYEKGVVTELGAVAVDTGILLAAHRKISTLLKMTRPAIPCGGQIKAKR
ncbi:hypothetical protein OK016_09930 [Vibrio chagasii]|nr:hypothetical protein [Vibrio chagasii]